MSASVISFGRHSFTNRGFDRKPAIGTVLGTPVCSTQWPWNHTTQSFRAFYASPVCIIPPNPDSLQLCLEKVMFETTKGERYEPQDFQARDGLGPPASRLPKAR